MFNDNKSSDNASRTFAVMHINADIRSSLIISTANPRNDCTNLTEGMATRSLLVGKRTPFAVLDLFPILVLIKMIAGHLSFPKTVHLSQVRAVDLVIASQEFGSSRHPMNVASGPKRQLSDVWHPAAADGIADGHPRSATDPGPKNRSIASAQ
jgi:hypothetical protein